MYDVVGDGNCGYNCVAKSLGYKEDIWLDIRTSLLKELEDNLVKYVELFTESRVHNLILSLIVEENESVIDEEKWTPIHEVGYLIAAHFGCILVSLSPKGSF